MNSRKKALVISYGPVPTSQYQKIEGGGMRAWGLARGLQSHGYDVTVAINAGFPQNSTEEAGIKLANWELDESFKRLINSSDIVVISYCMGDPSVYVANNIDDSVTLVLDAYVPIYIEVSARDSKDTKTEYINYLADIKHHNQVLQRGDYFLCANIPQKHMYLGILSSMGIINPATYRDDRIILTPFGIDSEPLPKLSETNNPYRSLGVDKNDFVLLWFGGLYPWFNFEPLITAVQRLSKNPSFKFVLVGGKNPFNNHPDFVKQYTHVKQAFTDSGLLEKSVFMIDWVDFDSRLFWYQGADCVISINQPGEENAYSWRTRVMDYVWGEVPMLTNGGDPLSDQLLEVGAALKVGTDSELTKSLLGLLANLDTLHEARKALKAVRKDFYWENVVSDLVKKLEGDPLPYAEFKARGASWGVSEQTNSLTKAGKARYKASQYYNKAREKGIRRSVKFALVTGRDLAKAKSRKAVPTKPRQKAILLSHPIDETGAPLVLLDVASDFANHYAPKDVHIVSPGIKKHILKGLVQRGFSIHKMAGGIGQRFIQAQLNIQPDDFVLMNTVALYENYRSFVYWLLETGRLKHAHWFIHEDNPKLRFPNKKEVARVKALLAHRKISIHVPSQQTADDYNKFFDVTSIRPVSLRVSIPDKLALPRPAKDFESLRFVTSGSPWDGRKGQFLLLNALVYFEQYLRNKSATYRSYEVHLLAMGNDYISKQLDSIGLAFFNEGYFSHKKAPREKALEITSKGNITVCSSLNETFALFVAEGMAMGHPILRNKSSGWQEQVRDGENGYLFESLSLTDLAEKLELLLNVEKTSNEQLAAMGRASQAIAQHFASSDYYRQLTS